MPIRAFLDGHKFDGETIRLMGIAFETALWSLGTIPGIDDPLRAALAHKIIGLAKAGERDPERLCEAALKVVRPPDPPGGIPPPSSCPKAAQRPKANRPRSRNCWAQARRPRLAASCPEDMQRLARSRRGSCASRTLAHQIEAQREVGSLT
jgi:hypothetical protein